MTKNNKDGPKITKMTQMGHKLTKNHQSVIKIIKYTIQRHLLTNAQLVKFDGKPDLCDSVNQFLYAGSCPDYNNSLIKIF